MTLSPPTIPSLRPQLLGTPFPGTELPSLPDALAEVQRWIDSAEEPQSDGSSRWHAWPDRPEFEPIYGPVSLNTGAAGIVWYALAAADAFGDSGQRARAQRALSFVAANWRSHTDDVFLGIPGTGFGHYGGLSGIGAVLLGASETFPEHRATAAAVFDEILARVATVGGRPFGWTGANALLGDGGIALDLLEAAQRLGDDRYLAAAIAAGEGILAEERPQAVGSSWHGLDAALLGLPAELELDGFELGTVGIAYLFSRLAQVTGDDRFRAAANRGATHLADALTVVGDAALLPRLGGSFSFGYCTGSSGAIRTFIQVHRTSGDPAHLEWALSLGRGILRSGVPGRQTRGNSQVHHQCCGSAAVLESFLGLWLETGDPLWLDAARAQGDDLLIRSVSDERGRRWYSESHVLPIETLKAEVGHQVGASGIALALLRLHQAERAVDDRTASRTPRLPDDPFSAQIAVPGADAH